MDIADLADRYIEDQLQSSLYRLQFCLRQGKRHGSKSQLCDDCGAHIPTARLEAVPGCKQCVSCAENLERRQAGYSRAVVFIGSYSVLDDHLYNIS
jgi:phage/conjugal plasmid C-4 type zinc finger TraR family protein